METLQQRMAKSAYDNVTAFDKLKPGKANEASRNKYGSMAHKLPILIHNAGLAQALAFVESRGSEEQRRLLDDVAQTMGLPNATTGPALATLSRTADLAEYMIITRRVLDALLWYKRFAESVLGVEAKDATKSDEQPAPAAEGW